jgi:hypothetical protein
MYTIPPHTAAKIQMAIKADTIKRIMLHFLESLSILSDKRTKSIGVVINEKILRIIAQKLYVVRE